MPENPQPVNQDEDLAPDAHEPGDAAAPKEVSDLVTPAHEMVEPDKVDEKEVED